MIKSYPMDFMVDVDQRWPGKEHVKVQHNNFDQEVQKYSLFLFLSQEVTRKVDNIRDLDGISKSLFRFSTNDRILMGELMFGVLGEKLNLLAIHWDSSG